MCTFKPLLGDYLDRELSPAEKGRVESHLGECAGCRAELDELKSLSNVIGGLPRAALPVGFMDRLERRRKGIGRVPAAASWRLPVGARAVGVAFAGILAAFVVYDRVSLAPSMISGAARNLGAVSEDSLRLSIPDTKDKIASNVANRPAPAAQAAPALGMVSGASSKLDSAADANAPVQIRQAPAAIKRAVVAKRGGLARARGEPIDELEKKVAANEVEQKAKREEERAYTNEELQRDLERQKRLLGVKALVAPERHRMGQMALAGGGGASAYQLEARPAPAAVSGDVADLLKDQELGGAGAGGAAADAAKPAAPPPPAPAAEGVVVRSEDERQKLWAARGMTLNPPRVDYGRQFLVVVFGPADSAVEIAGVRSGLEKTIVQYRRSPLPEDAGRRTQAPPYQFRAIPRTDKPVVFEALP